MYAVQVALLGAEALVMATLVLALFRSRTLLGLSPLYIVLGGFQYFEASLGLRVEVAPGWAVSPASTVMFTATLLAVLLVYIKEDTGEARKLVYRLVLANLGLTVIALIVSQQMGMPGGGSPQDLADSSLRFSVRVAVVGTTLLYLDVLGIILVYEYARRHVRGLFARMLCAFVVVVAFDNTWFTLFVQWGRPNLLALMGAGLIGKVMAAAFYTLTLWLYLRYFEPQQAVVGSGHMSDVFQQLTYRERFEQAQQRMRKDALTGLYNRGYFDEVLSRAVAHAQRNQRPFSLLFVDADNFKAINDAHSHAMGDRVLRLVGEALKDQARAMDTVCRYGGDEFIVVLADANSAAAAAFAERFRRGLRERCVAAAAELAGLDVTTTVGIATFLEDVGVATAEDLLRLADNRLYTGKRAGRNRIVWQDVSRPA